MIFIRSGFRTGTNYYYRRNKFLLIGCWWWWLLVLRRFEISLIFVPSLHYGIWKLCISGIWKRNGGKLWFLLFVHVKLSEPILKVWNLWFRFLLAGISQPCKCASFGIWSSWVFYSSYTEYGNSTNPPFGFSWVKQAYIISGIGIIACIGTWSIFDIHKL